MIISFVLALTKETEKFQDLYVNNRSKPMHGKPRTHPPPSIPTTATRFAASRLISSDCSPLNRQHPPTFRQQRSFDSTDTGSSVGYFSDGYDGYQLNLGYYNPNYLGSISSLDYPNSQCSIVDSYSNDYCYIEDAALRYCNTNEDIVLPYSNNSLTGSKPILKPRIHSTTSAYGDVFYDPDDGAVVSPSLGVPASITKFVPLTRLHDPNMYTIQEAPDSDTVNMEINALPRLLSTSPIISSYIDGATDQHYNKPLRNNKRSVRFLDEFLSRSTSRTPALQEDYIRRARETKEENHTIMTAFASVNKEHQETECMTGDSSLPDISEVNYLQNPHQTYRKEIEQKYPSLPTYR